MASQFLVGYAMVASHPRRCGTRLGGRPLDQRVSREFVENRRGVKGIKVIEESTDSCCKAIKISAKPGL